MQTNIHVGVYNIEKRKGEGRYLGVRKDWMQVMDRSHERGYEGNWFSDSNSVMALFCFSLKIFFFILHTRPSFPSLSSSYPQNLPSHHIHSLEG